jgi:hypothetical protein
LRRMVSSMLTSQDVRLRMQYFTSPPVEISRDDSAAGQAI